MATMKRARNRKVRREKAPSAAANFTHQQPATRERKPRRWLMWVLAGIFLLGAAGGAYALVETVLWRRIRAARAGTWRVQGGEQDGVELEFRRNGAFQARMKMGGKGAIVHALAEVDADDEKVLRITSTNPQTGQA